MAEYTRPDMQSEAWIDPAARTGIKRFMASQNAEQLAAFIRDCLRAVDRRAAVAIFNKHVVGIPMPASSDRGRLRAMLRDTLRAGRPDAFECLQNLTTHHMETALSDDQYEVYSTVVDELNEAAEAGKKKKIDTTAADVVAALRTAMDDDAIRRYVTVHALAETIDALLGAVDRPSAPGAAAAKNTADDQESDEKTDSGKATARKATGKKAATGKVSARKAATAKQTPRRATSGAAKATPAKRRTTRKSGG